LTVDFIREWWDLKLANWEE